MTDPRGTTGWKQTRAEEKLLLLLGAILDALLADQKKPEQPAATPAATPRRQKAN